MNSFFERITHMLKKLFPRIFGIPQGELSAAASTRQQAPAYLPEHKLTSAEIEGGVGPNGSCWEPWRTETNTGLRWYKRISASDAEHSTPQIHGIDADTHEHYDAAVNIERQHAWLMNDDGLPEETDELR
jgi:hypothetical protein